MKNINKVEDLDVQLGEDGKRSFENICKWLQVKSPVKDHRYAPSIVVRSEAEILGSSIPRFAVRAYIHSAEKAKKGFVNLRRLPILREHAPSGWQIDLAGFRDAIADCVLVRPSKRYAGRDPRKTVDLTKFEVLEEWLGNVYGEGYVIDSDFRGTPFLNHIRLTGGGHCAQAVCFMATLLLKEFADRVYGLAEITFMAQNSPDELRISGLNPIEIGKYFQKAGLRADIQQARNAFSLEGLSDHFGDALKSYLRSGMPVIVPVDVGRLLGRRAFGERSALTKKTSIYWNNGLDEEAEQDREQDTPERRPHAILLVGHHKRERRFLFNDPAAFPFMDATAEQLALAAAYGKGEWVPQAGLYMAVTPPEVRLLLHESRRVYIGTSDLQRKATKVRKPALGLLPVIATIQGKERPTGLPPFVEVSPRYAFENIRLTQLKDLQNVSFGSKRTASQVRQIRQFLESFGREVKERLAWNGNHWIWLQETPYSFWIFDAEKELPEDMTQADEDAQIGFLRGILYRERNWWKRKWMLWTRG